MSSHIDQDDLFKALANSRRRGVIRLLDQGDLDISDLAEIIAREEHDLPRDERVDGNLRKRVYVTLYQNHLDKLDGWQIVDWDKRSGMVSVGPGHPTALRVLRAGTQGCTEPSILDRIYSLTGGEVA